MDRLDTVLLTSTNKEIRQTMREILEEKYNTLEAGSFRQSLLLAKHNEACVVAVVMDLTEDAWEHLQEKPLTEWFPNIPVIVVCERDDASFLEDAFRWGAADVIPVSYHGYAMLRRIDNLVDLNAHKTYFQNKVSQQAKQLHRTYEKLLETLTSIVEFREMETGEHISRVRYITNVLVSKVAQYCPEYNLTPEDVENISNSSALHDIGKIGIPDSILTKPGALTPEEWEQIRKHPEIGCEILSNIVDSDATMYMRYAYNICRYHHERWDGRGYPEGLAGDAIPICAQVVGLADCFDALLSKRHYKEPVPIQQTMTMILNGECGAFSPKLLECFKASTQELQELVRNQTGDRLNMAANQDFPTAQLYETERDRGVLMDTLEIAQGKYLALMHYIDACILEIAFDDQHFHLQYNPYPELAELGNLRSIADLNRYMVDVMAAPEDQERMRHFMEQGIEGFLNSGMRRKSQRFKLINNNDDAESFDLTLLRVNVHQKEHRTFAILFKKLKSEKHSSASYHEDMLAQSTYCCYNDRYLTLVDLGGAMDSLMGYTKQEILRRFQGRLMDMIHPDDRMLLHEAVNNQLYKYKVAQLEYRMIHKDGSVHWVMDRSKCSTGTDGSEYIYTYLTDITQTKESIREDRDKLKHYEMILSRTDNVLFSWDYENGEISYSDVQDTLFSRIGVAENIDKLYSGETAIHPDDRPLMVDKIMKIVQGSDFEMAEIRIANGNGTYMWHRLRGNAIRDPEGRLRQIVGIIINIDDEKKRTLTLMDEASRDPLTGLLNKAAAKKQAEDYFSQYQSLDIQSAVLVIDLDNFKLANDRFGHLYGDALLTQVAGELKKLFRNQDIVARIGGDEFLVVMRGIADRALVENRCRQVLSSLQQLFEKSSKNLPLSCSIGVAVSAEHGNTYNELFQKADMALYDAKSQGKNTYLFYDPRNSGFYGGAPGRTTPHTAIESDIHPDLSHTNMVKHLFRILYSAQDVGYAVSSVLAIVGEISQVSRVYVFENSADGAYCSNTYEWCKEGILPQKDALQQVYYDRDIPGYREAYDENGILYCSDILELPKAVYNIVKPQGIKSMLHCAMMPGGKFRGYIGFDDCEKTRLWTKEEIELLRYFSEVLSVFLHQEYEKKQLLAQLKKAAPTEAHS